MKNRAYNCVNLKYETCLLSVEIKGTHTLRRIYKYLYVAHPSATRIVEIGFNMWGIFQIKTGTGTFRKCYFYQLHNNLLAIANETIRVLSQG